MFDQMRVRRDHSLDHSGTPSCRLHAERLRARRSIDPSMSCYFRMGTARVEYSIRKPVDGKGLHRLTPVPALATIDGGRGSSARRPSALTASTGAVVRRLGGAWHASAVRLLACPCWLASTSSGIHCGQSTRYVPMARLHW